MAGIETELMLGRRYRLIRRIASGGMGTVWEAEDTVLHRSVAVKVLSDAFSSDERFVERFRREARAAAGLSHPNVARVFDYGEDEGRQFIVMELLRGETLADRLRQGPMETDEAVHIAEKVADALQEAHDSGVIHRDVKPANIMLTPHGGVEVMDFGIAAAAWATPITVTGTTLGTASYISPEQAAGKKVTSSSDVYSLGVVLYEMLTGQPPFHGGQPVAVAARHLNEMPVPVRERNPNVSEPIATACDRALAKKPEDRPSSASAFAAMLRSLDVGTAPFMPAVGDGTGHAPVSTGHGTAPMPAEAARTASTGMTEQLGTRATDEAQASDDGSGPRPWLVMALLGLAVLTIVLGAIFGQTRSPVAVSVRTPTPSASPSPGMVKVPKVVGLLRADAVRKLKRADLRSTVTYQTSTAETPGVVLDTKPKVGTLVTRQKVITLIVAKAPATTTAPSGGGGGGGGGGGRKKEHGGGGKGHGKGGKGH